MKIGTKLYNEIDNSFAEVVGETTVYHRFAGDVPAYRIKIFNSNQIITLSQEGLGNWKILNNNYNINRR